MFVKSLKQECQRFCVGCVAGKRETLPGVEIQSASLCMVPEIGGGIASAEIVDLFSLPEAERSPFFFQDSVAPDGPSRHTGIRQQLAGADENHGPGLW
jgi:hypothetical protein